MIIKKAQYKKVRRTTSVIISEDVFGCDQCKMAFENNGRKLDVTVFFHDEKLKKQNNGCDTDKYEFCSWKCVGKFMPKIKTDYFVDLPYLFYDSKTKGNMPSDFLKLINPKKQK